MTMFFHEVNHMEVYRNPNTGVRTLHLYRGDEGVSSTSTEPGVTFVLYAARGFVEPGEIVEVAKFAALRKAAHAYYDKVSDHCGDVSVDMTEVTEIAVEDMDSRTRVSIHGREGDAYIFINKETT